MKKKIVLGLLSACFFATLFFSGCREEELYRPGKVSLKITEQKDVTFKSPKNDEDSNLLSDRILKNESADEAKSEEDSSGKAGFKDLDSREYTPEDSSKVRSEEEKNSESESEREVKKTTETESEEHVKKTGEAESKEERSEDLSNEKTKEKTKTASDEEMITETDEEIITEFDEDLPEVDFCIRDENGEAGKEKAVKMTKYGAFLSGDNLLKILEKADNESAAVTDPDTGKTAYLTGSQEVTVIGETDSGWYHIKKYTALGPMSEARIDGYVPKSALITAEEREQIIKDRENQ